MITFYIFNTKTVEDISAGLDQLSCEHQLRR